MRPWEHVAASTVLGAGVYAWTGAAPAFWACLGAGVLVDLDHLVDWGWHAHRHRREVKPLFSRRSFEYFFHNRYLEAPDAPLVVPLHGLEIWCVAIALAWAFPHPAAVGALVGYSGHLLLDVLVNPARSGFQARSYWLTLRIAHSFRSRDFNRRI